MLLEAYFLLLVQFVGFGSILAQPEGSPQGALQARESQS
jgi:hypothetical protein